MKKDKELKLHTKHSLDMLSCILERIATEVSVEEGKRPEYYSDMASAATMLADYINHIENDKELIDVHEDYDIEMKETFI